MSREYIQKAKIYFKGCNTLRFFSALFVVLCHIGLNQRKYGLIHLENIPCLNKGVIAVSFFFTLSGFLITYLLLDEHTRTNTISVKKFYIRRILRIWPLYFFVIGFGLVFVHVILPRLHIELETDYKVWFVSILYLLFLPHLAISMYKMPGNLDLTWSIGVEEQYYLGWAPLVKKYFNRLLTLILIMLFGFFALSVLNEWQWLHLKSPDAQHTYFVVSKFIKQLKFHYMAGGGLFAYFLFYHKQRLLDLFIFKSKIVQLLLFAVLIWYFFVMPEDLTTLQFPAFLLFGWLIVNLSSNPHNIIKIDNKVLDYFGKISYGIYMYHMFPIYITTAIFKKYHLFEWHPTLFMTLYYVIVISLSILIAHFSYQYFEMRFLRKSHKFAS